MRALQSSVLIFSALVAAPLRSQESHPRTAGTSTLAIGDVHGDYRSFRHLLSSLGFVDATGRWSGGSQHLVQTGDLVDRGAESRRVIEFLQRLEKDAKSGGGEVTVLLGNHEVMNLTGDLSYVSDGEFTAFARDEDPKLRRARRDRILSLLRGGSTLLRTDYYRRLHRWVNERTFDRVFPAGFFAHRRAFSPEGLYGRWLLKRPTVHREGEVLFVHGGISPRYAALTAGQINRRVRDDLAGYFQAVVELEEKGVFDSALGDPVLMELIESERRAGGPGPELENVFTRLERIFQGVLFSADGPLWYRGLAEADERAFVPQLDRILGLQGVTRIVVGHTPHETLTIQGRFDNRVILIDTGMNHKVYGGIPSALLFKPDGEMETLTVPLAPQRTRELRALGPRERRGSATSEEKAEEKHGVRDVKR